ncbi:MAG: M48 family metallopeptidase [Clostridia bacterium]|nr:M48 family metallopeptidase [Clostridia bacterium]MBR2221163.1 M48 family metallopeptidase [Clostridia bacterium]
MENEVLIVGGFFVKVIRKKMKNLRLVVKNADDVRVSAPKNYPLSKIQKFVEEKTDWILQNVEKMRKSSPPQTFQSGDVVNVLGQRLVLQIHFGGRSSARCAGENLILTVREDTPEAREKAFKAFCKRVLLTQLPAYFDKWQRATNLVVKGFSVRDMKSRWGSCNTKKQTISINLQVAQKPPECLDYLVLHEVAHIYEPSHNQNFKNFLSHYMPDWKDRRKMLKK